MAVNTVFPQYYLGPSSHPSRIVGWGLPFHQPSSTVCVTHVTHTVTRITTMWRTWVRNSSIQLPCIHILTASKWGVTTIRRCPTTEAGRMPGHQFRKSEFEGPPMPRNSVSKHKTRTNHWQSMKAAQQTWNMILKLATHRLKAHSRLRFFKTPIVSRYLQSEGLFTACGRATL